MLGYGCGDVAFNLCFVTTESFLLFFYTDVFGLRASIVTLVVVAGRVADVGIGALAGAAADRVPTRFGRYRPYLLWLALPLMLSFVLVFTAPALLPRSLGQHGMALALAGSVLFASCYAAANVPYSAMLAVLSDDPGERTAFASTRFAMASLTVVAVQLATLPLVARLGGANAPLGWSRTALLYGLLAVLLLQLCFAHTKERPLSRARERPLRAALRALFGTRQWYVLGALAFLALAAFSCRSAVSLFYLRTVFNSSAGAGAFLACNSAAALLACLTVPLLPARLLRGHLARDLALAGAMISIAFLFLGRPTRGALFVLQALFGLATGAVVPILFALFADLSRSEPRLRELNLNGVVAASALTAVKLGAALGSALVSATLAALHYAPGAMATPSVRRGVSVLFSAVPAALLGLVAVLLGSVRASRDGRPRD